MASDEIVYGLRGTDCPLVKDAYAAADALGMILPPLFRFYQFEAIGFPTASGLLATGSEFRLATRGPNKDRAVVKLKGTDASVLIPRKVPKP